MMNHFIYKPTWNIGFLMFCTIGIVFAMDNIANHIDIPLQVIALLIIFFGVGNSLLRLNSFFNNLQPKQEKEHVYKWNGKIARW